MSWRTITDRAKRSRALLQLAARLGRGRGRWRVLDAWAERGLAPSPLTPDFAGWASRRLSAVWLGHATVLLRIGGVTVLTDPVFSPRVGLGLGIVTAGPRRATRPAIGLRELPPVDVVIVSHAHFDHLDRPTLARLDRRAVVITSPGCADLISDLGFADVREVPWGESTTVGAVTFRAVPVTHWGARTFLDTHRGYGGFLIESPGTRVLYGGDTAFHELWRGLGPVDLAIVGIGAYDPFIAAHATPEQAVLMAAHAQAAAILPIHHSTFRLSHEPMDEPLARVLAAGGDRIVVRAIGGTWTAPS